LKIKNIPRGATMPRHITLIVADLDFEALAGKVLELKSRISQLWPNF